MSSWMDFPQSTRYVFPFLVFGSYLSAIPVANYLSKADGFASNYLVYPLVTALGRTNLSLSTAVNDDPRKLVVALTALYIFSVNIISGVMSVTGQLLGNKEGYRNKGGAEPRLWKRQLHPGLPLRMVSAHEALLEIFPAYAVTAALVALSLSSGKSTGTSTTAETYVPVNALVLHVFFKLGVYVPAYLLDVDLVRSISHMTSIGALLVALWTVIAT